MFTKEIYINRRNKIKNIVKSGIVLIPGNTDLPMNYPANIFHFRQDSTFLYLFGLNLSSLVGVIDIDNNKDYIFGNDVDLDDIIWMGPQIPLSESSSSVGVENTFELNKLNDFILKNRGRKLHYLPQYRAENKILLESLTGVNTAKINDFKSEELIRACVKLRSIKEDCEIIEIEKAISIGYLMHTTAMKMCKVGVKESLLAGTIEGISLSHGNLPSFPIILSQNGETLHNNDHSQILTDGRMLLIDCGAETYMNYCSDHTRAIPVNGRFSQQQKEVYQAVLNANKVSIEASKIGVKYQDIHLLACKELTKGLQQIGLMKGNIEESVAAGAHALFMPHGLGHMMGLDVHDMENYGENYVGYDNEVSRINQFGTAYLRLGRRLEEGFVITNEPGTYFIPALIQKWKSEKINENFINYNKLDLYMNFGGIRIEDDIHITKNGPVILGKQIPKEIDDVEKIMNN